MKILLRNEVDVNKVDYNEDFALRLACELRNDYKSILIDELLSKYVNVNISNKREKTTLMCEYLTNVNVKELIIHDAIINAINLNEENALHLACKWQANLAMIEALLRNDIDFIIRDRQEHIARYYMKSINKKTKSIARFSRFEILTLFRRWEVEHNLV